MGTHATTKQAAVQLICLVLMFIVHHKHEQMKLTNLSSRELRLYRQRVQKELMDDLSNRAKCRVTIHRINKFL